MCRRTDAGLRRTGKSCRLRWVNYLHPGLRRGRITADEERLILQLHAQWGSRWSRIARSLPGRTDNEIKNFWRTRARKQKAAAQQQQQHDSRSSKTASASVSAFSGSSSSSVTATTSSCSGCPSPSSGGCGTATSSSAVTESALRQSSGGCDNDDEDAELDEASTTAASQHHHHQQQQEECYASDHFWNDIAAAEAASYMLFDGWAGAGPGHPAAAAAGAEPPSSPTWEYCSDFSLWRIDDDEYYKKMFESS